MFTIKNSWRRSHLGLAFDERFVLAVRSGGRRDAKRGEAQVARRELAPGLLKPSAIQPNFESVSAVAQLAAEALSELEGGAEPLSVLLPDLALTTALFPAPASSPAKLRPKLLAELPFDSKEARLDFWRGAGQELLAAAIREPVAQQYEEIIEAVGCRPAWIDGASTALLPLWGRERRQVTEERLALQLQLYHRHYVMSVFRGHQLVELRVKLRSLEQTEPILEEVQRVIAIHGEDGAAEVFVFGEGAPELFERLSAMRQSEGRAELGAASEEEHLSRALTSLSER